MIKNLSSFVSKTRIGESISGVLITPEKIVATDSFKLIEIKYETGVDSPIVVQLPKGLKTLDGAIAVQSGKLFNKGAEYQGKIIEEKFPDYEKILPTTKPTLTRYVDSRLLKDICEAFNGGMKMELHESLLIFTNKDESMKAVLSPMTGL